jgi:type I restriction enzyme M protein
MSKVNLEFEDKLWEMMYNLSGNIESSEYKHVILILVSYPVRRIINKKVKF